MSRRFETEAFFKATPERMWQALTTTDELRAWMDDQAEIDPRAGGKMTISAGSSELLAVDPPRMLKMRWDLFGPNQPVICCITLEPAEGGTVVRVVEEGYLDGEAGAWAMGGSEPGWEMWFAQLQEWLSGGKRAETHPIGTIGAGLGLRDPEGSGIFFRKVTPGGAADEAGIREQDDLVAWNGVTVRTPTEFYRQWWKGRPGETVEVAVDRAGASLTLRLTLSGQAM